MEYDDFVLPTPFEREQERIRKIGWYWLGLGALLGGGAGACHVLKRPLCAASPAAYVVGATQTLCALSSVMLQCAGVGAMIASRRMQPGTKDRIELVCGPGTLILDPPVIETKYHSLEPFIKTPARIYVHWEIWGPPLWSEVAD